MHFCRYDFTQHKIKTYMFVDCEIFEKMRFTDHFSLHNSIPCNSTINRTITRNRKTWFKVECYDNGLIFIHDLLDSAEHLLPFEVFYEKYKISVAKKELSKIYKTLPTPLLQMIQSSLQYSLLSPSLPLLKVCDVKPEMWWQISLVLVTLAHAL